MKVYPCNTDTDKSLSFEEACREEGIYSTSSMASNARLIVLRNGGHIATLYYTKGMGILENADAIRSHKGFVRTNEKLCVEIK